MRNQLAEDAYNTNEEGKGKKKKSKRWKKKQNGNCKTNRLGSI